MVTLVHEPSLAEEIEYTVAVLAEARKRVEVTRRERRWSKAHAAAYEKACSREVYLARTLASLQARQASEG